MENNKKSNAGFCLSPRLELAAELINKTPVLADIGCDHGKLPAALIKRESVERAIAIDISAPSLKKAEQLRDKEGITKKMDVRQGDGLLPLRLNEATVISICGMGGELIKSILQAAPYKLMGSNVGVFSPNGGVEELREYLYQNGYKILEDRIAVDCKRYYQVFSVTLGREEPPPYGWPIDFYTLGYKAMNDVLFTGLCDDMLKKLNKRLITSMGTKGEKPLLKRIEEINNIKELAGGDRI